MIFDDEPEEGEEVEAAAMPPSSPPPVYSQASIAAIEEARSHIQGMREYGADLNHEIQQYLQEAGADAPPLDPTGNLTNEQVLANANMEASRYHIRRMSEYGINLNNRIQQHIRVAGADASPLDPTGNLTNEQVLANANIAAARFWIQRMSENTDGHNNIIQQHICAAGADAPPLDPTGNLTNQEVLANANIAIARRLVGRMSEYCVDLNNQIQQHICAAGADAPPLDPTGNLTNEQVLANANMTAARNHVQDMRKFGIDWNGAIQDFLAHAKTFNPELTHQIATIRKEVEEINRSQKNNQGR